MNMTLQDWIESYREKCDMWQWLVRTVTAFTVAFAIVLGACCGLAVAGKMFPKAKTQITEVAR